MRERSEAAPYPLTGDGWTMVDADARSDTAAVASSLFALSNGFVGVRAHHLHDGRLRSAGVLINGAYVTWPIQYPESAYGLATHGQGIVAQPDVCFDIEVDGTPLTWSVDDVAARRSLDLAGGVVTTSYTGQAPRGATVEIMHRCLVSFTHRHLTAHEVQVRVVAGECEVAVRPSVEPPGGTVAERSVPTLDDRPGGAATDPAGLAPATEPERIDTTIHDVDVHDPRRSEAAGRADLVPRFVGFGELDSGAESRGDSSSGEPAHVGGDAADGSDQPVVLPGPAATWELPGSGLAVGVATRAVTVPLPAGTALGDPAVEWSVTAPVATRLAAGDALVVDVQCVYSCTAAGSAAALAEAGDRLSATDALRFADLAAEQRRRLERYWSDADIRVADESVVDEHELQRDIRWHLFQLFQASAAIDAGQGIPAKGLTGAGYDGHYFWDTEMYIAPALTRSDPEPARRTLLNRVAQLDKARARAAQLAQAGASLPWRTIDGHEASAYFLAGTAQYHVNAAFAFAVERYERTSGDTAFVRDRCLDVLAETSRLWFDLGFRDPIDGRFHIHGVTGPDEYSVLVNDNLYTNAMARRHLRYTVGHLRGLHAEFPERFDALADRIGLAGHEIDDWQAAADDMAIPFDEALGINPQDDAFLRREPWDFAGTPASAYPLLLHFHPLVIYRHQVLKQPDTLLAMITCAEDFDLPLQARNYDFYLPRTTGDSSLTDGVHARVAAGIDRPDEALVHFEAARRLDLWNTHHNTADGVHLANSAALAMTLVEGFGGVQVGADGVSVRPSLPQGWTSLEFSCLVHGQRLHVGVCVDRLTLRLGADGRGLEVTIGERVATLAPGGSFDVAYRHGELSYQTAADRQRLDADDASSRNDDRARTATNG